jgi:hypothetical protein
VSIESIQDSNLLTAKTYPDYDPQPLRQSLLSLTQDLRAALQAEQALQPLLVKVTDFHQLFAGAEKYASNMSLMQTEQGKIRGIIVQIKWVRDSDFIQPAYAILELFTIASTIALLLIGSEEITESIVVSSLLFVVFLYLLLLIKDLDNPFQYGGFSSVDSSVNYPTLSGVPLQFGLVSELHRNSENLERISALVSPLDTLGDADKLPVLVQSCRTSNVLIAIFRAPTKSACSS